MLKRGDVVLLFAVCLLALLPLLFLLRGEGEAAVVRVDGQIAAHIPLTQEGSYPIQTKYGYNVLRVLDGRIRVLEADCPDRLCVSQGEISRAGESLACLPHRMSVALEGGEGLYDAVIK